MCARGLRSDSALRTARSTEMTSRAEAGWFAMICAGIFAATEPHSEQQRWMDAGKGVERRG